MQNGKAVPGESAIERPHLNSDDPTPLVGITFRDEKPDAVAYRRILEIVFRPRNHTPVA